MWAFLVDGRSRSGRRRGMGEKGGGSKIFVPPNRPFLGPPVHLVRWSPLALVLVKVVKYYLKRACAKSCAERGSVRRSLLCGPRTENQQKSRPLRSQPWGNSGTFWLCRSLASCPPCRTSLKVRLGLCVGHDTRNKSSKEEGR